jgi:plastocyanin domain-containing protein
MTMRQFVSFGAALSVAAMLASALPVSAQGSRPAQPKVQTVKLSVDDKGYVVTPDSVVKGIPVRMEVDLKTVKGCARTVVIGAVNVKKTVKEGETVIEFTPTRTGKIELVCGMDMVHGAFTVVDKKLGAGVHPWLP